MYKQAIKQVNNKKLIKDLTVEFYYNQYYNQYLF